MLTGLRMQTTNGLRPERRPVGNAAVEPGIERTNAADAARFRSAHRQEVRSAQVVCKEASRFAQLLGKVVASKLLKQLAHLNERKIKDSKAAIDREHGSSS